MNLTIPQFKKIITTEVTYISIDYLICVQPMGGI